MAHINSILSVMTGHVNILKSLIKSQALAE